jgi:hypothetical protein
MTRILAAVLGAATLLPALTACGYSATYRMRNGSTIIGEAESHSATHVRVQTSGGSVSIDRCDIDDVFHPGRGAAITGGVIAILSGLIVASVADNRNDAYVVPLVPLAVGGGLGIWGLSTWYGSAERTGEHHLDCASSNDDYDVYDDEDWDSGDTGETDSTPAPESEDAEHRQDGDAGDGDAGDGDAGDGDAGDGDAGEPTPSTKGGERWQETDPPQNPLLPDTY